MRGVDFSGVRPPEIMSTLRRRWPTGQAIWSAAAGNYVQSSPAVANGVVYLGSADNNLYAFNAATGQRIWTAGTYRSVLSSPAVANGVVYVGSDDAKVYAFTAVTGLPVGPRPPGTKSSRRLRWPMG